MFLTLCVHFSGNIVGECSTTEISNTIFESLNMSLIFSLTLKMCKRCSNLESSPEIALWFSMLISYALLVLSSDCWMASNWLLLEPFSV